MFIPHQTLRESSADKGLNPSTRFTSQFPILADGERRLQPNNQVVNTRSDAIWPVVKADAVVRSASEGNETFERNPGFVVLPLETLLADVWENAVILGFDDGRPA